MPPVASARGMGAMGLASAALIRVPLPRRGCARPWACRNLSARVASSISAAMAPGQLSFGKASNTRDAARMSPCVTGRMSQPISRPARAGAQAAAHRAAAGLGGWASPARASERLWSQHHLQPGKRPRPHHVRNLCNLDRESRACSVASPHRGGIDEAGGVQNLFTHHRALPRRTRSR